MGEALIKSIDTFISNNKKYIEFGTGKKGFQVEINEDIDINDIHNAIENIVDNVIYVDLNQSIDGIFSQFIDISIF